jgi:catechol 2,3-dioxygenase-like lactoylglutathione lyase family enzyme
MPVLTATHGQGRSGASYAREPRQHWRHRGDPLGVVEQEDDMPTTRVQLALNVSDLAAATDFYAKLFGAPPHKQRPGYANFIVEDPPLKLVLVEQPGAVERLNHLGVETATPGDVTAALARFQAAGLEAALAEQDLCCHAEQDKVFVTAPDVPTGIWEFYAVTDDNPADLEGRTSSACASRCESDAATSGGTCCA